MNIITVLLSSFIKTQHRSFSFELVAENISASLVVAKMDVQQTSAERMLNTLYLQR